MCRFQGVKIDIIDIYNETDQALAARDAANSSTGGRVFAANADAAADRRQRRSHARRSIASGRAQMSADGTTTLRLHTLWPAPFTESEHVYMPDDPHYALIKAPHPRRHHTGRDQADPAALRH